MRDTEPRCNAEEHGGGGGGVGPQLPRVQVRSPGKAAHGSPADGKRDLWPRTARDKSARKTHL